MHLGLSNINTRIFYVTVEGKCKKEICKKADMSSRWGENGRILIREEGRTECVT